MFTLSEYFCNTKRCAILTGFKKLKTQHVNLSFNADLVDKWKIIFLITFSKVKILIKCLRAGGKGAIMVKFNDWMVWIGVFCLFYNIKIHLVHSPGGAVS